MSEEVNALEDFLLKYTKPGSQGRFFTKSQVFIAYRAFLARTRPNDIVSMDFGIFCAQLDHVREKLNLKTKLFGKSVYYELFLQSTALETNEAESVQAPSSDGTNVLLHDVNIFLCCKLCCGYLVDATTIAECLHSFCKSCIVKHFQTSKSCPVCGAGVHSSNPTFSLKSDIVLQDIVAKLLPGTVSCELERAAEFSEKSRIGELKPNKKEQKPHNLTVVYLEWIGKNDCTVDAEDLNLNCIKLSDQATIAHISQFVVQKLGKVDRNMKPTTGCEVRCGGAILPPFLTIEQVVKHGLDFETKKGAPHLKYDLKPFDSVQ